MKGDLYFMNEVNLSTTGVQPWFFDDIASISKQADKYGISGNWFDLRHSTMDYPAAQKHV